MISCVVVFAGRVARVVYDDTPGADPVSKVRGTISVILSSQIS